MQSTNEGEREAKRAAGSAADEARALGDTARDEAAKLADTAKEVGRDQAEKQLDRTKRVVEDQIGTVEAALDGAAQRLEREDSPLASYASDLSSRLSGLSSRIESASVDDLARDGRRLARENPAMFMLGAVAVGFVASRFLKASDQADRDYAFDDDDYDYDYDDGPGYGDAGRYRGPRPYDAYGSSAGRTGAYRSPVAGAAGPRDAVDPMPRAPMDSNAGAGAGTSAGTVGTSTTGTSTTGTSTTGAGTAGASASAADATTPAVTRPRVNRPVNDLGAGAADHANAGAAPRNSNEGGN